MALRKMSRLINQNAVSVTVKAALIEYLLSSLGGGGGGENKHTENPQPIKNFLGRVFYKK